jgi:Fic family protein
MPGRLVSRTWTWNPTINAPPARQKACRYDAFIPDELSSIAITIDATLGGLVSEAEHAVRHLNDEATPALGPLARLLLRTESIASSRIEGLQMGARELARAEARDESGIKAGPTAAEVLANIDAMVLAVDQAATVERVEIAHVVDIHRRLMHESHPRIAGAIRTDQNWIGGNDYNPCGADFVPPPPEEVARLMSDLAGAINDDTRSPLLQAALVHAQFETIHPFADGNGRAGRALIHVALRRRRMTPRFVPPISVVFSANRERYIAGLTRFRSDDVNGWIEQFAEATIRAANLARAYVRAVSELQADWRDRVRARSALRADATAWMIIDLMPAHPMISAPVISAVTGRARSSVYEAIEQLVGAGVLIPLSGNRRNRWWEADGLLDLIARLESGHLPAAA